MTARAPSDESILIANELLAMPSNPFTPPSDALPSPEAIHVDAQEWAEHASDLELVAAVLDPELAELRGLNADTAETCALLREFVATYLGVQFQAPMAERVPAREEITGEVGRAAP